MCGKTHKEKKKKRVIQMKHIMIIHKVQQTTQNVRLKWVDENGWGSCGEQTGKNRANQLATANQFHVIRLQEWRVLKDINT